MGPSPPSERRLVDMDAVVGLQHQLWTGLAEAEQDVHQSHAPQRGRFL